MRRLRSATVLVFVLALAARTARVLVTGGFLAPNGYDPGVYYAGAAGLVNGRLPYRDFSFVHPPGIVLLEAPFALLGRVTTDLTGYATTTAAAVVLSSVSAVLVVLVARATGLPERAAVTGGLVYALWTNTVAFEVTARLEPVGNFLLLLGLVALHRAPLAEGRRATRLRALAGLALGATVAVKLWWVVPVAVLLGWLLVVERRGRELVPVVLGAVAALVVVDLPFLLLTGGAMWDSVVLDQLAREDDAVPRHEVFSHLVAGGWADDRSAAVQYLIIGIGLVVLAVVLRRAWRSGPARALVAVLVAQCVQLAFQPVWFPFYSDFPSVPLCLLVAAAFAPAPRPEPDDVRPWLRRHLLPTVLAAGLAVNATVEVATWEPGVGASPTPFPRAALTRAVAGLPCVASDQPMGLIQVDALSRSFRNRCPEWVDVVGRRLRFNRVVGPPSQHGAVLAWDRLVLRHLERSDALLLTRPPAAIGLSPASAEHLRGHATVVDVGGYPVYRMPGLR